MNDETLTIHGEKCKFALKIVKVMKACEYLQEGCSAFLAKALDVKSEKGRLEDIPVTRDYPKVFLGVYPVYLLQDKLRFGLTW
jgi:hypothetical protein